MNDSVFVGRIPLYDHGRRTTAYELVVTDGVDDRDPFHDRERAVRRLLGLAVHKIGLDEFVGGRDVWIPMTVRLMHDGHHETMPPRRTVLQIDPTALRDSELVPELERARRAGYRIALDLSSPLVDVYDPPTQPPSDVVEDRSEAGIERPSRHDRSRVTVSEIAAIEPMLDALKINPATATSEGFATLLQKARKRMLPVVAVGVETVQQRSALSTYDFFEGSYVLEPVGSPGIRLNHMAALELIAELQRPNATFEDVEKIIGRDPSLSMRILTLANSGLFSLPKRVDSTRAALVMLGLSNVRHMALMMTLNATSDVPAELTVTTLVRARHCELLANAAKLKGEVAFTVGLLSLAGAFAGVPNAEALAQLPITAEVSEAIEHHRGSLGVVMRTVVAGERCELASTQSSESGPGPQWDIETIASTYIDAIRWAERLRGGSVRAALASA